MGNLGDEETIVISDTYCAIYDFGLMPYALGDVLTWNIHSAIRCEQQGRKKVDVFICLDERFSANIHQRDFAIAENCGLLFNELFGAFGTHPRLGNVYFFRDREEMVLRLKELANSDAGIAETIDEYETALDAAEDIGALNQYLAKNAYSHDAINGFLAKHGRIPLLCDSLGYRPDVAGLVVKRFAGKRIVTFHMRNRRLDAGYGGTFSYSRDSDFLEWYEFLCEAGQKYPDVQFVALGRMQEKPLELLTLPNVTNLRDWGLGLGHELTLMRTSDLFIGASSGFAAMANFCEIPYFITRMTKDACKAYGVAFRSERLPFGTDSQILVYEPETKELLMRLLERGLSSVPPKVGVSGPVLYPPIDVRSWVWERSRWLYPSATSYRFFNNALFADKETAFLLWPHIMQAQAEWHRGLGNQALMILRRLEASFPRVCERFPEFLRLKMEIASAQNDMAVIECCKSNLKQLATEERGSFKLAESIMRLLVKKYPMTLRLVNLWKRKQRAHERLAVLLMFIWTRRDQIPRRLIELLKRLITQRRRP
jgi:hypothetical protein